MANDFASERDEHIKGAEKFNAYQFEIHDLRNLPLLTPLHLHQFLEEHQVEEVTTLDLCAGTGHGGSHIDGWLNAYGHKSSKVIFVDNNEDRSSAIYRDPRYEFVEADVTNYAFPSTTLTCLRYGIYYFREDQQTELIQKTYNALDNPGCFILFGVTGSQDEANFVQEFHEHLMKATGGTYSGRYVSPESISQRMEDAGFRVETPILGELIYSSEGLGKKYGLDESQREQFAGFLANHPFVKDRVRVLDDGNHQFSVQVPAIHGYKE